MIEYVLSAALIAVVVLTGPRLLLFRAILRSVSTVDAARDLAPKLAVIVGGLLCMSAGGVGYVFGPTAVFGFAVVVVLIALAAMDLAWRWLPLEWLLGLGLAGFVAAFASDMLAAALQASVAGAALLAIPRVVLQALRGYEVMGLGDVFLAAAIGLHTDVRTVVWALTGAAISALVTHFILTTWFSHRVKNRLGVAFGAHIALIYAVFHIM
ncbi:MAG: prepilin peptidase [Pseudomonadota bacterium]